MLGSTHDEMHAFISGTPEIETASDKQIEEVFRREFKDSWKAIYEDCLKKVPGATPMEILSLGLNIAHFEGQSVSTNTLPFITEDSWEIHWSYTADEENPMKQFLISIVNQNTEVLNVPVMHYGETESGVSYYPKKGKYYLTVVATGSWSVTIMSSN